MSETPHKILLLGLGNDILTDDAIGLRIVREARRNLAGLPSVEVRETMEMGLALLDFIAGCRALVLVDSIQTMKAPPGFLHEFGAADLKMLPASTPHFVGVGETVALGRKLCMPMPDQIRVFAVEVQDPFTVSEALTPQLAGVFPQLVERVTETVRQMAADYVTG